MAEMKRLQTFYGMLGAMRQHTPLMELHGEAFALYTLMLRHDGALAAGLVGTVVFPLVGTIIGAAMGAREDEAELRAAVLTDYPQIKPEDAVAARRLLRGHYDAIRKKSDSVVLVWREEPKGDNT